MINFKNKSVVVLGLGISGFYSATLLKKLGARVFISDKNDDSKQKYFSYNLKKLSIDFELGRHTKEIIEKSDYLVLSPGLSLESEPVKWAINKNIQIIGEMELGYQHCPSQIIAVTGSNGKTTVTTLIGRVLKEAGKNVFTLGNIGQPLCSCVDKMKKTDMVSLEVSSFQLETIKEFRPKISLILNFSPNHLDRYRNLEEYLEAKKRIFINQKKDDFVILNYADSRLRSLASEVKAKVVYFNDDEIRSDKNKFNANQLAVIKVAQIFNVGLDTCLKVFKEFKGIEHRMEYVLTLDGIDFINDSKSTTPESTIWALNNSIKPVILIVGGRDKGCDFKPLRNILKKKVKYLILFGEAKERIKNIVNGAVRIDEAKDLYEAVNFAFRKAKEGYRVLFSPMCASFDMFSNYEERGRIFKKIVNNLKSHK